MKPRDERVRWLASRWLSGCSLSSCSSRAITWPASTRAAARIASSRAFNATPSQLEISPTASSGAMVCLNVSMAWLRSRVAGIFIFTRDRMFFHSAPIIVHILSFLSFCCLSSKPSFSHRTLPACFVLAKLIVPETEVPETMGKVLQEHPSYSQDAAIAKGMESFDSGVEREDIVEEVPAALTKTAAVPQPVSRIGPSPDREEPLEPLETPAFLAPMESIVVGALDGLKMAGAIAALLIAVLGLVAIINLFFTNLASLASSSLPFFQAIGRVFQVITLQNIAGALFLPLTFLTGVSLKWPELWQSSVLIGQRLLLTEVPSFQQLAVLASQGILSQRALLVVSYALCGFAHFASVGIFVGGMISLVPARRRDISELGWKALWAGTLATLMIGCIAGLYDTGNPAIIGR
ncbi:hypothetical protein KIK02_09800 [Leptodesmis sichuanensis A121]|nr:hypothetical protein KIK02_09800 [Leptodesmis sichuanensis A121]